MKQRYEKRPNRSLVERLREAESKEEITQLLAESETFTDASQATVGRWIKAAKKRNSQLES